MAIVKTMLKKHHQRKDGTYPVVIYVYESKPQYIYTGYSVREDQFKDGRVVRHPDAALINPRIDDLRAEISASIIPGVGYVKGGGRAGASGSFSAYLRKRTEQYKHAGKIYAHYKTNRMIREIESVTGRDISFAEVNIDWIRAYAVHCASVGNVNNTVMKKIKDMRILYGQAIAAGVAPHPNPFDNYKLKFDPVHKTKLTAEQIRQIERVRLGSGSAADQARNAFLFSFYAQGMRFENVCLLRWSDIVGDAIKYRMNKGRKWREVYIHERLKKLIDRLPRAGVFVFPWVRTAPVGQIESKRVIGSANAIVNASLKSVAEIADIPVGITFHMARHTFAYLAKSSDVTTDVIKDALGHSDTKITEAYLKSLSDDHINQAVSAVWKGL